MRLSAFRPWLPELSGALIEPLIENQLETSCKGESSTKLRSDMELKAEQHADFTISHYRELCGLALEKRLLASFDRIPWGTDFLLWRHDIDMSVNRALKIAHTNSDFGLHSTFFVHLHSPFYNPMEANQAELLREIALMGHDFGVHFDSSVYPVADTNQLEKMLEREASILADLIGVEPLAFSFHDPSQRDFLSDHEVYAGLQNAYSMRLRKEAGYCSDSNGYWRHERLADSLSYYEGALQVLTHPEWWQDEVMSPRRRVDRAISGRAAWVGAQYDAKMAKAGRSNIR